MARLLQRITLTEKEARINGALFLKFEGSDALLQNFKKLYKQLDIEYPKFYKMDRLSKLAFLAAELLLKEIDLTNYDDSNSGIILGNKCGSLESDLIHNKNTFGSTFQPSPAVFVYTLPNIMIGEVAIRHNFKGENAYLAIENDFWEEAFSMVDLTLKTTDTELLVLGLVELHKETCNASLALIDNSGDHSLKEIIQEFI